MLRITSCFDLVAYSNLTTENQVVTVPATRSTRVSADQSVRPVFLRVHEIVSASLAMTALSARVVGVKEGVSGRSSRLAEARPIQKIFRSVQYFQAAELVEGSALSAASEYLAACMRTTNATDSGVWFTCACHERGFYKSQSQA